jgi:hypothetical protein
MHHRESSPCSGAGGRTDASIADASGTTSNSVQKKRDGKRLSARLKAYFPQVLNWFEGIGAALLVDMLVIVVLDA